MKVGVYFTPKKEQGGVYQYSVDILEALSKIKGNKYIVLTQSPDVPEKYKKLKNFKIIDVYSKVREATIATRDFFAGTLAVFTSAVIKYLYKFKIFELITPLYKLSQKKFIDLIEKEKIDLMFYPTSSDLSFLAEVPAVVTVHDLQHRLNPQFKEVSAGGRWEYREYGFINIAKKAFKVLVDSEIGKEEMLNFYPKAKGKVVALPYLPPSYLDPKISLKKLDEISEKLKLPKKFVYYPSKFWPHKNHINLVKAIGILNKKGISVNLVLTGSSEADFSTFDSVQKLIKKLNLEKNVFYLGYVDSDELSVIYKKASALVMPTSFGPTNIPVLEAWLMKTPVVYSNVRGCKEQLGSAGLLIDPYNPKDIANKIAKVYSNKKLADKLTRLGYKRVNLWNRNRFTSRIKSILEDFSKSHAKRSNHKI